METKLKYGGTESSHEEIVQLHLGRFLNTLYSVVMPLMSSSGILIIIFSFHGCLLKTF